MPPLCFERRNLDEAEPASSTCSNNPAELAAAVRCLRLTFDQRLADFGQYPVVLSSAGEGESLAVISISKAGEFDFGEKRIEKAALENEIRHRIKAKPGTEKALAIKCSPDITYGSLEDIYPAAFAAGAKRIILDATLSATREQ